MRVFSGARLCCAMFVFGSSGPAAAEEMQPPNAALPPTAATVASGADRVPAPQPIAQPATAAAKPAAKTASVQAEAQRIAIDRLEHGDALAIQQAIGTLVELNTDAGAKALAARLRRGLPPQLTEAAIDGLVLLQRPAAVPVLLELVEHRRAPLRVKAVTALGALHVRTAQSALLYALDDPSAEVRAAAVQVLGQLGNARALPALFTAAGRGVAGAWLAIGNLAGAPEIPKLLALAEGGDITPLRPALDALFARANLPNGAKLSLLRGLEKLDSPSARSCVVEWLAAHKATAPAPLRVALFDAIKRMDQRAAAAQGVSHESKSPPPPAAPKAAKPSRNGNAHSQRSQPPRADALVARQEVQ